jgi:hypothetical protein
LYRQGRHEEALAFLRSGALAAPGWMPAVQALVEGILLTGDDLQALLSQRPPDPLEVGAVLFRLGRYDLAVPACSVGGRRPNPADHHLTKAIAHLRLGDIRKAGEDVASAWPSAESSARAYVLHLVRFTQGRLGRGRLEARYGPEHAIWRDVPPAGNAAES